MRRRRGDLVDGVLPLDKPVGISSNTALQRARQLIGAARAGHTGTLDPLAGGLLPLTFGEATKFSADLLDASKAYLATVALGITTTTGDAEGDIVARCPVQLDRHRIDAILLGFSGLIKQVPPMYSALKREGKPLYDYARAGLTVERAARDVTIHRLHVAQWDEAAAHLHLEVACSKGTYIRVLAEDIGAALGCGAHLAALRRTEVGSLRIEAAVTLDALEGMSMQARRDLLMPADTLIGSLPRVDLDEAAALRLRRGQQVVISAPPQDMRIRAYAPQGRLLGTGWVNAQGVLAPQRLISEQEAP